MDLSGVFLMCPLAINTHSIYGKCWDHDFVVVIDQSSWLAMWCVICNYYSMFRWIFSLPHFAPHILSIHLFQHSLSLSLSFPYKGSMKNITFVLCIILPCDVLENDLEHDDKIHFSTEAFRQLGLVRWIKKNYPQSHFIEGRTHTTFICNNPCLVLSRWTNKINELCFVELESRVVYD